MVKCIRATRAERQSAPHPDDLANIEAYVTAMPPSRYGRRHDLTSGAESRRHL